MVTERVWTKREQEWAERLKGNTKYRLTTLEDVFNTVPPTSARDAIKEGYGWNIAGAWCLFYMLHLATEVLKDTAFLCHSTLNCMSCSNNFHTGLCQNYGCSGHVIPVTGLDKRHVVFGGEDALYDAIKAVDRDYRPKLIIISIGCAPGLTQDDVVRVVTKAQTEVGSKLYYMPTAGYETDPYQLGDLIHRVTSIWVDLMDPPAQVDQNAVNILGNTRELYYPYVSGGNGCERRYPSDVDELGRYIEAMGFRVHRVLHGGDYDYIRTAPEAAYNTIYCGTWGFPLADLMEKRFGTKWVKSELPLGIEPVSRWIRGLGTISGREEEAEKLIKAETEAIHDVYERCREAVQGKVMILGGAVNRPLSWLRFGKEMGMDVMLVAGYPEMGDFGGEPLIKDKFWDVQYFLEDGFNPVVIALNTEEDGSVDASHIRPWVLREKLGLDEDEVIYSFPDFTTLTRAGRLDPSSNPYHLGSTHMHRRVGCTSRAAGFAGTKAWCEELLEDLKAAKRKKSPTMLGRVHGDFTFNFEK